jgi:predicted DNA-binding WGR domain protein
MKPLTDLAVIQAAEELMFQTGQTTTLDVKNLLRKQNYEATQAEVSSRMENVARQESWQINSAGAHRVYKPAPDTDQNIEAYWELASAGSFWEVKVAQKNVFITTGRAGTDGTTQTLAYHTNREAVRQAQLSMQEKRNEGYSPAVDTRLSFAIRQHFAPYFNKTVVGVRLAYFGVVKARKRAGKFVYDNTEKQGEQIQYSEGGYEFSWDLPTEKATLEEILDKDSWIASDYQKSYSHCLGEKAVRIEAWLDGRALPPIDRKGEFVYQVVLSSWQQGEARFTPLEDWQPPHSLEIYKDKLFQAYLTFDDGSTFKVNRYDGVFADKHNARKASSAFWATVKRFVVV